MYIKLYDLFESYNGLTIDCRNVGLVDLTELNILCVFKCNLTKVANASIAIISDVKSKM